MIMLLIGPHRSGKTTTARSVARRICGARFFDLDELIGERFRQDVKSVWRHVGPVGFIKLCQDEIENIARQSDSRLCLCALGAGATLDPSAALPLLCQHHSVALTGSAEKLYPRADKTAFPSFEQYRDVMFSPERQNLYAAAKFVIDVSDLTPEGTEGALLAHLLDVGAISTKPRMSGDRDRDAPHGAPLPHH
jgi:shikimate kinase